MLPIEISLNTVSIIGQIDSTVNEYCDLMMDNIDKVTGKRMMALNKIEKDKLIVAKA